MVDHAEESFIEWLHPRFDVDQCHQDPRRDMVSQSRWYELSFFSVAFLQAVDAGIRHLRYVSKIRETLFFTSGIGQKIVR